MIGLAICTHSHFAEGLRQACEMIAGPQTDFAALGFLGDEDLLEYSERIREASRDFAGGCIYVTDLVNATPFNAALAAAAGTENAVLTGVSLPMMMELIIRRNGYEGAPEMLAREILASSGSYVSLCMPRDIFQSAA